MFRSDSDAGAGRVQSVKSLGPSAGWPVVDLAATYAGMRRLALSLERPLLQNISCWPEGGAWGETVELGRGEFCGLHSVVGENIASSRTKFQAVWFRQFHSIETRLPRMFASDLMMMVCHETPSAVSGERCLTWHDA